MASDRARVSYDPSRGYRALVAQQGRVTVEADWNEATAIGDARDEAVTLDVVGPVGTPDGGYAVTAVPAGSASGTPGDLNIGAGTLYLGGERLELDQAVTYSTQPDWLDFSTDPLWVPPAVPPGTASELVWLLAYEQEVSAVEDTALSDVALGGPDTMQRERIQQHFVRQSTTATTCDAAWAALLASPEMAGVAFDAATMRLASDSELLVTLPGTGGTPSVCEPVATGGYLGAENQMIRVMVTAVNADGSAQIVWGFDDASFMFRTTGAPTFDGSQTTVNLASAPVDSYHNPVKGQAVELLRDSTALSVDGQATGDYIASADGWVGTLAIAYQSMQLVIEGEPPSDYLQGHTPLVYVRVWQDTLAAPAGTAVALGNLGVSVTLTTSGAFHVGDFWRFAVRPLDPTIVYPARYLVAPQPPDGPRTWGCPLAMLSWDNGTATVSSCVPPFKNLVELTDAKGGCCTVDVGPGDVEDGAGLPALIESFANMGPVTICFEPGTYTLTSPIVIDGSLDGLTLSACRGGVVFTAPPEPGPEFVTGLISIQDAIGITITGITFVLPLVPFTPAADSFSGLPESNQQLMNAYSNNLLVSIGISVDNAFGVGVVESTFFFPNASEANLFAAGIFATGIMDVVNVSLCTFETQSLATTAPFYDLAAGNQTEPPYQLSVGYLQIPTFPVERGFSLGATVTSSATNVADRIRLVAAAHAAATAATAPAGGAAGPAAPTAGTASAPAGTVAPHLELGRLTAAVTAARSVAERALASRAMHVVGKTVAEVAADVIGGPLAGAALGVAEKAGVGLAEDVAEKAGAGLAKDLADKALTGTARAAADAAVAGVERAASADQASETHAVEGMATKVEQAAAERVGTAEAAVAGVAKEAASGDVPGAIAEAEQLAAGVEKEVSNTVAMATKSAQVSAPAPKGAAASPAPEVAVPEAAAPAASLSPSPSQAAASGATNETLAATRLVTTRQFLHDAAIENCMFQGVTVPAIVIAQLGTIRCEHNTVRSSYGGFWFVSLVTPTDVTLLDRIAQGSPTIYRDLALVGLTAFTDRIWVMATAIGRILPASPPVSGLAVPGRIVKETPVQLAQAQAALTRMYTLVSTRAATQGTPASAPAPSPSPSPTPAAAAAAAASPAPPAHARLHEILSEALHRHAAPAAPPPPAGAAAAAAQEIADTSAALKMLPPSLSQAFDTVAGTVEIAVPFSDPGTSITLRLDVSDNEIDAVIADSYSGAAVVVLDFVGDASSVLLNDSRIRNRFPDGQTALLWGPLQAAIGGNIISNEVVMPNLALQKGPTPIPWSLVLWPNPGNLAGPQVVIMGNTFIDLAILPARLAVVPPPVNNWAWLNNELLYVAPTGA